VIRHATEQNNFASLAVALVLLLFTAAVVDEIESTFGQRLVEASLVLTLAIGVWSIKKERVWFRTGLGFTAATLAVVLAGLVVDLAGLETVRTLILLGFFVLTAWLAARQVLFTGPIDENKMIGAVCIYLLLGLVWAMLYLLVLAVQPTAFNGVAPTAWHADFPDIVYFSFVSLTTLGFGDVTPAEPIARFLVYLEAVVGQFYLAILVVSLVGIRLSDMKRRG